MGRRVGEGYRRKGDGERSGKRRKWGDGEERGRGGEG